VLGAVVLLVVAAVVGVRPSPVAAGEAFTSGMVSITFDDNDASQFAIAKPLLDARNWKSTFYLEGAKLRDNFGLTQAQLRQLASEGHEMAAHTVNHSFLASLNDRDLQGELADPISLIPQLTGAPVPRNFASPFGQYNPALRARFAAYYRSQRGISQGVNFKDTNPYDLASVLVDRDRPLSFVQPFLQKAKDRNGWVILTYHDLAPVLQGVGGVYQNQVTTQAFTDVLAEISRLGLRVVTVDQAVQQLGTRRAAPAGQVLYAEDVIESGFINYSFGQVVDLSNNETVHGGSSSIKVKPDGVAGVQLLVNSNMRTADYEALEFWVNGGPRGGQRVYVEVRDYSSTPAVVEAQSIASLIGRPIPPNEWVKVRFTGPPGQTTGVSTGPTVNVVRIAGSSDVAPPTGVQDPIWIDDVVLVPKAGFDPEPPPTVLNAAAALSRYVPLPSPVRALDTRSTAPIAANGTLDLAIGGANGVPASASAVLVNVTGVRPSGAGFVQVRPTGGQSGTSTLNIEEAGQTIANSAIVKIGTGGKITMASDIRTDLIVDVQGYFVPLSQSRDGRLTTLAPTRVFDTRTTNTPISAAGQTRVVPILGKGGVPSAANQVSAVVLNVTAADATPGYIQVGPSDSFTVGAYSNLNVSRPGQAIANLVVVRPGADGAIKIFTEQRSHLIVDVFGYFTGTAADLISSGLFVPIDPERKLDTRNGARPGAGSVTNAEITRPPGVTAVKAIAANITLTGTANPGFVQAGPPGLVPFAWSNVNADRANQTIPNAAIVPTGTAGPLALYSEKGTHLIVDQSGVFVQ
jgi:peptidoglycan/xylan/chitin deacetylase (PgdA/CDA1 family)